jgi:putative tryptophan/tyrosine transport system substrate-binding protein
MFGMKRREFITLLGGATAAWTLAARAQPAGKVWRIGMLDTTGEAAKSADISAFRRGLAELGYTEEKNLIIDYRSADGRPERFPALVAELLSRKIDLIVTRGTPAAVAAKEATSTIPVVMAAIADPLLVVRSLARPGGNLTGFSSLLIDLPSKQAELVKEMVPGLTRVGSISNMSNAAARAIWKEFQEATAIAGIEAHLLDVRTPSDIVSAFDGARKQRINALLVTIDTLTQTNQQLIIELTTKHQLPAIFMSREFVDAGGLMSYGVHYPDLYRRAATVVHKIFNGAKPADLPVEQPTRFEFVINLRTAKALGLNVPDKLLAIADEVIE